MRPAAQRKGGFKLGNEARRPVLASEMDAPGSGGMPPTEYRRVIVEWNQTNAAYSTDTCLHELVEHSARRAPEAVAIVFDGRRMSYRELNEAANQLGRHLVENGVARGETVAVFTDRSTESVVALLAVLKAGATYVPLEPSLPSKRVAWIMGALGVRWALTQWRHIGQLTRESRFPTLAHIVCMDAEAPAGEVAGRRVWGKRHVRGHDVRDLPRRSSPDDAAYVVFTSGSTGTPKGVVVAHRPVVNLIEWVNKTFSVGPQDRLLFVTSLCFDLSVYDVFGVLAAGACVCVAAEDDLREPVRILRLLTEHGITFWDSAPAMFQQLVPFYDVPEVDLRSSKLRLVFLSGDWIPVTLPDQITQRFQAAKVVSLGGATEATIWSNFHVVDRVLPGWTSIPYGRPIQNARYYILDAAGRPCPVGVAGELHIGGECLALGYLDEMSTKDRFVADPYNPSKPDARMYRTGDRATFWPDGTIEFLGRIDSMVKIRGFRVELGEVEAVLNRHPEVGEAVVTVNRGRSGENQLIAHIRPAEPVRNTAANRNDPRLTDWAGVFDNAYSKADPGADPRFNIEGWVNSYTGEPFAPDEMREWIDRAVARVRELPHSRVLEVGCGTGLFLARLGGDCDAYFGLDISRRALEHIGNRLLDVDPSLRYKVKLAQLAADQMREVDCGTVDLVVINSVAQYFPSLRYLAEVLEQAATLLSPGGAIFVGDVRNYALMEEFHALARLHRADGHAVLDEVRESVREYQEHELLINPEFFTRMRFGPNTVGAQALLKTGVSCNELNHFRYDVVLAPGRAVAAEDGAFSWLRGGLEDAVSLLSQEDWRSARVLDIPNSRVRDAISAREQIKAGGTITVGELRSRLAATDGGVDPAAAAVMIAEKLPGGPQEWRAEPCWPRSGDAGCFDLVISRRARHRFEHHRSGLRPVEQADARIAVDGPWSRYANSLVGHDSDAGLAERLRQHVREELPDYMVPSRFVVVDRLPMTSNGKVDRKGLGESAEARPASGKPFVAPSNEVEVLLGQVWADALAGGEISSDDRFFDIGGDSLLAVRVVSKGLEMGLRFTVTDLIECQTLEALARRVVREW
jgi:amino acid adenylation domain-containing protein